MSTGLMDPRGASVSDNTLSTSVETTRELGIAQQAAAARYEIESAIVIAKKFPRNEDQAYQGIIKSCKRPTFAGDVAYSYPRGQETVEGPSVYLAREMARLWGNIRFGVDIVADDEDNRTIRAWAWDMQTNSRVSADDSFAKLVYRKKGGWIKPDERDLRELTNRRSAILIRNCLLNLLPPDFVEDALATAKDTLLKGAKDNIDEKRKKIITAFGGLGVSVEQLEIYLGHAIATCSPHEVVNLGQVWKSINDGQSKWSDYVKPEDNSAATKPGSGSVTGDDLTKGKAKTTERPSKTTAPQTDETSQVPGYRAEFLDAAGAGFQECDSNDAISKWYEQQFEKAENDEERNQLTAMAAAARTRLKGRK
jgi:hypothetical protein